MPVLIPVLVGVVGAALGTSIVVTAIVGAVVGAVVAAATGQNVLLGALTGAIGAYSGYSLATAITAAPAPVAPVAPTGVTEGLQAAEVVGTTGTVGVAPGSVVAPVAAPVQAGVTPLGDPTALSGIADFGTATKTGLLPGATDSVAGVADYSLAGKSLEAGTGLFRAPPAANSGLNQFVSTGINQPLPPKTGLLDGVGTFIKDNPELSSGLFQTVGKGLQGAAAANVEEDRLAAAKANYEDRLRNARYAKVPITTWR